MYGLFVEAIYDVEYSYLSGWDNSPTLVSHKADMLVKIYKDFTDDIDNYIQAMNDLDIYKKASPNFNYSVRQNLKG